MSSETVARDVRSLSDFAWRRLLDRIVGIRDEEYNWEAAPGVPTIAWRLHHIGSTLAEGRNAEWLGLDRAHDAFAAGSLPATADLALTFLDRAYASWTSVLDALPAASLMEPIGAVGGKYGEQSRFSFVLHVLDELIHHAAEVALLRDLYRARTVVT
jgi:uncharacterized damage-inducible protein DinB